MSSTFCPVSGLSLTSVITVNSENLLSILLITFVLGPGRPRSSLFIRCMSQENRNQSGFSNGGKVIWEICDTSVEKAENKTGMEGDPDVRNVEKDKTFLVFFPSVLFYKGLWFVENN